MHARFSFVRRRCLHHKMARGAWEALQLLGWHNMALSAPLGQPCLGTVKPRSRLHYMPQCEVTPAGFANCVTGVYHKSGSLCAEVEKGFLC